MPIKVLLEPPSNDYSAYIMVDRSSFMIRDDLAVDVFAFWHEEDHQHLQGGDPIEAPWVGWLGRAWRHVPLRDAPATDQRWSDVELRFTEVDDATEPRRPVLAYVREHETGGPPPFNVVDVGASIPLPAR